MSGINNPGCVVLLVDESAGMNVVMGEVVSDGFASTKTNLERLTTAVNAWLGQLVTAGKDFDVALIGYQSDSAGAPSVGSRWGGPLAGREWVSTRELAASPLRVETRTRKIPDPSGFGAREEQVPFSVWYAPTAGIKAPQIAAYVQCREVLTRWSAEAGPDAAPPIVVHLSAGASGDGNPQLEVLKLLGLKTGGGTPLVMQIQLAASANTAAALYPSNVMFLTAGGARDLFQRASPLPEASVQKLKSEGVPVNAGARALLYGAKLVDVSRALGLVKHLAQSWPDRQIVNLATVVDVVAESSQTLPLPTSSDTLPLAESPRDIYDTVSLEQPPFDESTIIDLSAADQQLTDPATLVVVVLDRSVESPYSPEAAGTFGKLQDQANNLLQQLTKSKVEPLEAAIVSYGVDSTGMADVRGTFDGPLAGKTTATKAELAEGAVRVEEYVEEMSNGVGGILSIPRKKTVFFDFEPTSAAGPGQAFQTAANIVSAWNDAHPSARLAPVVVHFTRGAHDALSIEAAAGTLRDAKAAAGAPYLFHVVATEYGHQSVQYPDSDGALERDELKVLFRLSDPLIGAAELAADGGGVSAGSRGLTVNAKLEVLVKSLEQFAGTR